MSEPEEAPLVCECGSHWFIPLTRQVAGEEFKPRPSGGDVMSIMWQVCCEHEDVLQCALCRTVLNWTGAEWRHVPEDALRVPRAKATPA